MQGGLRKSVARYLNFHIEIITPFLKDQDIITFVPLIYFTLAYFSLYFAPYLCCLFFFLAGFVFVSPDLHSTVRIVYQLVSYS